MNATVSPTERCQSEVWVQRRKEVRLRSHLPLLHTCSQSLNYFFLFWRILQFPRPVKLEELRAKAKVAFGQTMDLHYTNNEVGGCKTHTCMTLKVEWSWTICPISPLVVGDSSDHSGRPRQGCGAAGSKCSHEESKDPPGAPEYFSGQQSEPTTGTKETLRDEKCDALSKVHAVKII